MVLMPPFYLPIFCLSRRLWDKNYGLKPVKGRALPPYPMPMIYLCMGRKHIWHRYRQRLNVCRKACRPTSRLSALPERRGQWPAIWWPDAARQIKHRRVIWHGGMRWRSNRLSIFWSSPRLIIWLHKLRPGPKFCKFLKAGPLLYRAMILSAGAWRRWQPLLPACAPKGWMCQLSHFPAPPKRIWAIIVRL